MVVRCALPSLPALDPCEVDAIYSALVFVVFVFKKVLGSSCCREAEGADTAAISALMKLNMGTITGL